MRAAALALFLAAAGAASPAAAQSRQLGIAFDEGRGIRECSGLSASFEGSGAGRALHRGPGEQYPLLGRIGGGRPDGGARRIPVEVLATYDGWLRVRGPEVDAALAGLSEAERTELEQSAWIVGHDVSAEAGGSRGYTFPSHSSRVALWSADGRPLSAYGTLADIVACDGPWVFGRWRLRGPEGLRYVWDLRTLGQPIEVRVWTLPPSFYPQREDRRRAMDDWLVESFGEEELSRAVRLSRVGTDFTVEYHASFWHGNRGPYYAVRVERLGNPCGGEEWAREPDSDVWRPEPDPVAAARDLRSRLTRAFEACDFPAGEIAAALAGLEPAFAVAAAWSEEDRRHVLAVAEAIAGYGTEPAEPTEDDPGP